MYTLTLIAQKGGTGKTTLAINLSVAAEATGWRAALVDLDPQASAAGWGDHRGGERPAVAAIPAMRLDAALQAVRGHGADIALIDTAPHSTADGPLAACAHQWVADAEILHRKRGREAIEQIGLIPAYRGTLVHDCWASYLRYEQYRHLCGAHLLRELTFVVESNNYRWARLLKALLQQACRQLNRSQSRLLSAACKALRQCYRTILTQGAKELPAVPPRSQGQRGRIAKSAAHNLHERLVKHEASVLGFLRDAQVSCRHGQGTRRPDANRGVSSNANRSTRVEQDSRSWRGPADA